ncbi:hypothetical protein [Treponema zioleckii]|uniref:hypothetical protein n=1 Tax=Treponema zioleckii TaxID=331680 RepID=UPI00168BCFB2|nr:hypothetical protein [Treponema zioleckii]
MNITIRKKIFSVLAVSFLATSAFSVEWGGLLDNDSTVKGNKFSKDALVFDQKDTASLWIRAPFNDEGSSYFTAEGTYQFEKNFPFDSEAPSEDATNYIDLDLFKFVFAKEIGDSKITTSVGRFFVSDLSSAVYTQNSDGVLFSYEGLLNFSVYGGYTGLLNGNMVSIMGPESFVVDSEKNYDFADKYIVGIGNVVFRNVFANQDLSAEFMGTFRLADESYNRMYGTLSLAGPLPSGLYYGVSSTVGFVKFDAEDMKIGNLSKLYLSYYSDFKSASITLNGTYASGKQGPFDPFKGFTKSTAVNSLNEEDYSSLVLGGLTATIKPVYNLLVTCSFDFANFFEVEGFAESHKGIQYKIGANWQLFSDVLLGLNFGQYHDFDIEEENKVSAQLKAVITF